MVYFNSRFRYYKLQAEHGPSFKSFQDYPCPIPQAPCRAPGISEELQIWTVSTRVWGLVVRVTLPVLTQDLFYKIRSKLNQY